jgi:hypothetical protein
MTAACFLLASPITYADRLASQELYCPPSAAGHIGFRSGRNRTTTVRVQNLR